MGNWIQTIKQTALYRHLKGVAYKVLWHLPVDRRKVILDNFAGRGFGDDPKYIALELQRRDPKLKLYWVVREKSMAVPEGLRPVVVDSLSYFYHMSTAKVWIDNTKAMRKPPKKISQFYVQTWHSTLGLKKNEQDAATLTPEYVRMAQEDAAKTDLMYSDNDFRLEKYRTRYWYSGPVIKCDVPRMGILFHTPEDIHRQVREFFGIPAGKKLALYVPTFRKDVDLDVYRFDYEGCLRQLEAKFGGEFVFLIRLHPNIMRCAPELLRYDGQRLHNASPYPDIQELLAAADVLISDFSGCLFDFAFVGKPVFLLAQDLDAYLSQDRGTYFSPRELPFPLATDDASLAACIHQFSPEAYRKDLQVFMESIGFEDHGTGAKAVADIILDKIYGHH